MKFNALLLSVLFVNQLFATSMVEFGGSSKTISASGLNVEVKSEAKVTLPDSGPVTLKLSGAGIRKKSVFFVPVNVYVLSSYVVQPEAFKSQAPIEVIKSSPVRVLKMTMLRGLSGSEISQSFQEALDYNGVDTNQTAFVNIFSEFNFDAKPGDSFTVVSYQDGSMEKAVFEFPHKTATETAKDLGVDFWKVWFGKAIDGGIEELQKQLIGKN